MYSRLYIRLVMQHQWGHCFLQGTSLVRKTLLLHCKHVTVDGVVFIIPRWASLHDLVELLPFADFPFRVINCHIGITFSDISEIFQNQMLCPYGYILFHTAQSCYQIDPASFSQPFKQHSILPSQECSNHLSCSSYFLQRCKIIM